MLFEDIIVLLGEFGKYQKVQFFLVCLATIITGIQNTILVYTFAEPKHRCRIPGLTNDSWNNPDKELVDQYTPTNIDDAKCNLYLNGTNSSLVRCNDWVYDKSEFENTFLTQFNLVCGKSSLVTYIFQAYLIGVLVGAFVTGWISDRFGRKICVTCSAILTGIVGTASVLAFDPYSMLVLKFLTGLFTAGTFSPAFVLGVEFIGPSMRPHAGIITMYFYDLGVVSLAGIAYAFRDWRSLQLIMCAPCFVCILFIWFLPESPRWLVSVERLEEAEKVIRAAGKMNKVELPEELHLEDEINRVTQIQKHKENFIDMFKSKVLFFRLMILFIQWTVISMVYFGLTYSSGYFPGNFYLTSFLNGIAEVPGFMILHILLNTVGRRLPQTVGMMTSGLSQISTIFLVLYASNLTGVFLLLVLLGKVAIACAFGVVFIWTAELIPTSLRSTGLGTCSMMARFGSLLAPIIANIGRYIQTSFGEAFPLIIFGVSAFVAGAIGLFLPETLGTILPETIKDCEDRSRTVGRQRDVPVSESSRTIQDIDLIPDETTSYDKNNLTSNAFLN